MHDGEILFLLGYLFASPCAGNATVHVVGSGHMDKQVPFSKILRVVCGCYRRGLSGFYVTSHGHAVEYFSRMAKW